MRIGQPYHYVRFKWWRMIDMKEVAAELGAVFSIKKLTMPKDNREISLFKDTRDEMKVGADTLGAILSPVRAVLFQRETAPFTARDMELRRKILELYPRDRPTPFPLFMIEEPKFEVAE